MNSINPDVSPIHTDFVGTAPPSIPQEPITKVRAGLTTFEAIKEVARSNDIVLRGHVVITELKGEFSEGDAPIEAKVHVGRDGKEYFSFDVKWKATVTDANDNQPKTIEFTQTVFTSVKIPKGDKTDLDSVRKYESAKQDAFKLAKSYELIQRHLTVQPNNDPDIRTQIDALKTNNRISFQKPQGNLQVNHKISEYKVYSGNVEITSSFQTAARTNNFCLERFRDMGANPVAKKIILPEGSSKLATFEHMQRRNVIVDTLQPPLKDEYEAYIDSKGRYDYESQEPEGMPEGIPVDLPMDVPEVVPDLQPVNRDVQNEGDQEGENELRAEAQVEGNEQGAVLSEIEGNEQGAGLNEVEGSHIGVELVSEDQFVQSDIEIELEELPNEVNLGQLPNQNQDLNPTSPPSDLPLPYEPPQRELPTPLNVDPNPTLPPSDLPPPFELEGENRPLEDQI